MLKVDPGTLVLTRVGGTPELSVAVGSVQPTIVEVLPCGAGISISVGQPNTIGGMTSIGAEELMDR